MSENRRVSTRNRGEPPLKKRALTPSPPPAPPRPVAQPPRPLPPPAQTEDGLPVKLKDGRPLPTLSGPQLLNPSSKAFQTVAESGVLAASIEQSRQKWLSNGVFERYWSKPSKKKDMASTPNPSKETMTRIGTCSMIIDPHVFEITLYSVKEAPITYAPVAAHMPPHSTPQYNPFTPNVSMPAPTFPAPSKTPFPPYQPQQIASTSRPSLPPFAEGFGSFGPQGSSSFQPPPLHPLAPISRPAPSGPSQAEDQNMNSRTSQVANAGPKPDPVIQMLATRAASNPELKALMKVVASGRASPEQLREFQDHIDELNSIIKSRQSPSDTTGIDNYPARSPDNEPKGLPESSRQPQGVNKSGSVPTQPNPHQLPAPIKVEPQSRASPATASPMNTKPAAQKRSDIDSIVFDFGGSGDRFTFPRFSILEYLYGGTQVVVSFLVIRRGNTATSGKYKGNMSYYQPVTMRLTSHHLKLLEPLSRIVAPQEEVRQYMDSFFDKLGPAEGVYLATRLPRATEDQVHPALETTQVDERPIYPAYSPPNSIMPLVA